MKEKLINLIKLVFILIVFFNISYIFGYLFTYIGFDLNRFDFIDLAYGDTLLKLVICMIITGLYYRTLVKDLKDFKKTLKANLLKCLVIFGILFGIKIVVAVASSIFALILGVEIAQSENQSIINSLTGSAPFIMLLSSVIFAPFLEEGLFRLGFKKIINNKWLFIVISGLVFGFMHIFPSDLVISQALMQSLVYLAMGITLAYIYEETKNIYFVMIIHALNNLVGIVAVLLWL